MTKMALEGVKVLEYAQFVAGPYCSKLLADLGAEVIKVEKPGVGDEARRRGPFPNDIPHPERSGLFLYLNTNKMGITLNVETATGKEVFMELVKWSDILVEDKQPEVLKKLGLDYESLKRVNPTLITTCVTPFGQTGPYRDYKAYNLNVCHSGLLSYFVPDAPPERAPVKAGGLEGDYLGGLNAALATLAALYGRRGTGLGQMIDVSIQETLISLQRVRAVGYINEKMDMFKILTQVGSTAMGGQMRCKDGYITATFAEDRQWASFVKLLGDPGWAKDEKFNTLFSRAMHSQEIEPYISEWMMNHTKSEIYHRGQAVNCPIVPVNSPDEVVNDEQLKARGFFAEVDHPKVGKIRYPSAPYQFSETPWAVNRPAPLLGQHNAEVYCSRLGSTTEDLVKMREAGII